MIWGSLHNYKFRNRQNRHHCFNICLIVIGEHKSFKAMEIHNWTQTGKRTYITALCQKSRESVEIKQRPIKMDSRTITGHCHLKGRLFKLGLTVDPTCEGFLEEDESATHILCDCEDIAHLRFCHLGQFFMEPGDYYDAPISKVLHFIRSVVLRKG
jgi:hypothetical protein